MNLKLLKDKGLENPTTVRHYTQVLSFRLLARHIPAIKKSPMPIGLSMLSKLMSDHHRCPGGLGITAIHMHDIQQASQALEQVTFP